MKKPVSKFFQEDAPAYGAYDNLRKIPNMVDGLKISQRKLLWTGFKKARKDFVKTETFANLTALETAYIHGSASLCTVCDSLVQQFVGAANYAFFTGNTGGWGCRLIPASSAPRYTRLKLNDLAATVFNELDDGILEKQYFEGQWIEPKYFVPVFPVIFLNSSDGVSTGFSSKIYSRDPKEIIEYIKRKLSGSAAPRLELLPWFRNFKGTVKINPETKIPEAHGKIEKINSTLYKITELPIGMDYQKYLDYLNKFVETGKIVDYIDKCDSKTDMILFEIKTTRAFTNAREEKRDLEEELKLIRALPENLNCIDENNRVKEYSSVHEILDDFIELRLKYYSKRKDWLLRILKDELLKLKSKFIWCNAIITKKIVISNRPKNEIIEKIEKDFSKDIIKIDGDYSYLLNMSLTSITKEKIEELKQSIIAKGEEYKAVLASTPESLWLEDLRSFSSILKKLD